MLEMAGDSAVASEDCGIVKVLSGTPSIYQMELIGQTFRNLVVGDVPGHLPAISPVKVLLIDINFEDMKEMLAAFCIFRSSPVIQKLGITAISDESTARISSDGSWGGEDSFNCTFYHLKFVEVTDFSGVTSELKFIEFVLANAPVLERLRVEFRKDVADMLKIVKVLIRYRRISPRAELFLPD